MWAEVIDATLDLVLLVSFSSCGQVPVIQQGVQYLRGLVESQREEDVLSKSLFGREPTRRDKRSRMPSLEWSILKILATTNAGEDVE